MKAYNLETARKYPGEITALYLHGRRFPKLPAEIRTFRALTHLEITRCGLEEVPAWLNELTSLESLNLCGNRLMGLEPRLLGLPNLHTIRLDDNQLEVLPAAIGDWQQGRKLALAGNRLSELPPTLGKLEALQLLDLSENRLTKLPSSVEGWKDLRMIRLSGNRLTRLGVAVRGWRQLEELWVDDNRLSRLPAEIEYCSRLVRVEASGNRITEIPSSLKKCTSLVRLNLADNRLEMIPASVFRLPRLRHLDLANNRLAHLPASFGVGDALRALNLSGNRFSEMPEALRDTRGLEYLRLAKNQLKKLPPWIEGWQELRSLDVQGNQLEGIPPELAQLSQLEQLNLRRNPMTDLPVVLFFLPRLQEVIGLTGTKKFMKLYRAMYEKETPPQMGSLLWAFYRGENDSLDELDERALLELLDFPLTRIRQAAKRSLLAKQQLSYHPLESGCCVWLAGNTLLPASYWQKKLKDMGVELHAEFQKDTTHVVVGKAAKIPAGQANLPLVFLSEQDLQKEVERHLGKGWLHQAREDQHERLRSMLRSDESGHLRMAIQLLREGGIPPSLKTDVYLQARWSNHQSSRRTLRALLTVHASPKELDFLKRPGHGWPDREALRKRLGGTDLDADRIWEAWSQQMR